jgi:predicted phosphoribosyltransferase
VFANRIEAAKKLASRLAGMSFHAPIVLGIPRGGAIMGDLLARELRADFDVVLARKLRAPYQPELALGAVGEDGVVYLDRHTCAALSVNPDYLHAEQDLQFQTIEGSRQLYRGGLACAPLAHRSVIITDDGMATGATMIAALHVVNAQEPFEVIVAVPVAPRDRLSVVQQYCDDAIYLRAPKHFQSVGQFYLSFDPVEDEEVTRLLRKRTSLAVPLQDNRQR